MPAIAIEKRIDALLVGAIDPHVHTGPSIAARALDHLEYAQQASRAGLAAIVTKDHDYSGVMTAALIAKHYPDLKTKIYSGIALNNVVGGLNPYAVEHTAAMGGKIVWLPTLTAENHFRWEKTSNWVHPASTSKIRPATPVPVLNSDKTVRDDLKEILDVVAKNNMTLASGHLHGLFLKKLKSVASNVSSSRIPKILLMPPLMMSKALLPWALTSNIRCACFLKGANSNPAKPMI